MKFLVIFLCVAVFESMAGQLPRYEAQQLKQIHDMCQFNPDTYADENKLRRLPEYIEDRQVGIHMLCMSMKAGLQRHNGQLDRQVIRNKVAMVIDDPSQVEILVKRCAVEIENPEKTAVYLVLCFVKNDVQYYHKM